jgi:hypothetical protein
VKRLAAVMCASTTTERCEFEPIATGGACLHVEIGFVAMRAKQGGMDYGLVQGICQGVILGLGLERQANLVCTEIYHGDTENLKVKNSVVSVPPW